MSAWRKTEVEDPHLIPDTFCQRIAKITALSDNLFRITVAAMIETGDDERISIVATRMIWTRTDLELAHRQVGAVLAGLPFLDRERPALAPN